MVKIAPSILCADFANLASEIKKCERSGVDMIHIDVMDGHFVQNLTIGPIIVKAIRPYTKLPLEAHLMIDNPWMYIEEFIKSGTDIVTLHAECYGKHVGKDKLPRIVRAVDEKLAMRDIKEIRSMGARAAMALNPGTPLCIEDILGELDMVLVMSVDPGFSGQKFKESVLPKIEKLRKIYKGDIAVDGGINYDTGKLCVTAGANILATASYFFNSKDPRATVVRLKNLA